MRISVLQKADEHNTKLKLSAALTVLAVYI